MSTIRVKAHHVSSQEAYSLTRSERPVLDDATAVTIASWWQSPGRIGSVLAGFASGAPVIAEALLSDVQATINEERPYASPADMRALRALEAYVKTHSEGYDNTNA